MKNPTPCEGHSASTDLKSSMKLVVSSVIGTGAAVLGLAGWFCHLQSEKVNALTADVARLSSTIDKNIRNGSEGQEALKQQLDALKEVISTNGVAVVDLRLKADNYWKAAKKARAEGSKLAHVLYVSAMTCAENKHEIMMDYVEWRSEELGKIATVNPIDAEQLVADTAVLCDNLLSQASVSDLEKFAELRSALDALKEQQEAGEADFVEEMRNQMKNWKGEMMDATSEKLLEIQASLQALDVYTDLAAEREPLLQQVAWRLDCMTAHDKPLRLPVVAPGTPWVAWLKHFNARLRDENLPADSRWEDYVAAEEVLAAASEVKDVAITEELKKCKEAKHELGRLLWLSMYEERDEIDVNMTSQLIQSADSLPKKQRDKIETELNKLRREQANAQIKELEKQKEDLKDAPEKLKAQLLSSLYLQVYSYRLTLKREEEVFNDEINKLSKLESEINTESEDVVKKLSDEAVAKRKTAEEKFKKEAKDGIEMAERHYAGSLTADGDEAKMSWLKNAWLRVMGIDRNDLSRVSPNLYQRWSEIKAKIEVEFKPQPADYPTELKVILKYE